MELVKDTNPILRQPTVDFDFESGIDPEKLSTDMAEVMFQNGSAHRIQALSVGWRGVAHKWLQRIGLEKEGHLKGFAENGYDVLIFGKIKEQKNG